MTTRTLAPTYSETWFRSPNFDLMFIVGKARFLSRISQSHNRWLYMLICLSITTIVYVSLDSLQNVFYTVGIPSMVLIYTTINFHHYLTDSFIWKLRKPQLKKTLGLT